MLFGIGMILVALGTCMADSEYLIIPFAFMATGAALMYFSSREESDNAD